MHSLVEDSCWAHKASNDLRLCLYTQLKPFVALPFIGAEELSLGA